MWRNKACESDAEAGPAWCHYFWSTPPISICLTSFIFMNRFLQRGLMLHHSPHLSLEGARNRITASRRGNAIRKRHETYANRQQSESINETYRISICREPAAQLLPTQAIISFFIIYIFLILYDTNNSAASYHRNKLSGTARTPSLHFIVVIPSINEEKLTESLFPIVSAWCLFTTAGLGYLLGDVDELWSWTWIYWRLRAIPQGDGPTPVKSQKLNHGSHSFLLT